ncbi:hypothetical protein [Micromonospora sp. WMMD714]|uniref:hypothetical protein n=1 Tax=Micromonospora sp. WMMD714 TaxID=3016097 RepID=UPI00249BF4BB|nr:hypothetical protein [Micromonospora sp. WMMD714]WFE66981.1 hypothetical protein O7625_28440 [Micromonospora sp. WMMD714]
MGRLASAYGQAVTVHRQARQRWTAASAALARLSRRPVPETTADLVARLSRLANVLAAPSASGAPAPVRIGEASTAEGRFPLLLPLGAGRHLAVDGDARDPRVAVLLRVLVLRLLSTAAPGTVRVVGIDPAAWGATFLPLRPLRDVGVLGTVATSGVEIGALLDAVEAHAHAARQTAPAPGDAAPGGVAATGGGVGGRAAELLLVVAASAPGPKELARLAALTHAGPAAGVCVLFAGRAVTTPGQAAPALGGTTEVRLDERYARIGDPPGQPFSDDGTGLAVPVLLDDDPPASAVRALADRLGAQVRRETAGHPADLLPGQRRPGSTRAGHQPGEER